MTVLWMIVAGVSIAINAYLFAVIAKGRRRDHSEAVQLITDLVKDLFHRGER